MKLSLTIAGRSFTLDVSARMQPDETLPPATPEPDRQGATCGDIERAPSWDHDQRPQVGFRT